ncbi:unnamed protein product [Staurois parvus]|uniref:Uncharacterized protein n=1 Tax=Staurois parvus TaxID=386267 RepID=A0ABN9F5N8_9NEOB|nr:unnamed protein product [Staurois parvus]
MTERGQRMQCAEVANCLQSQWLKTSKLCVAFRELHGMGFHGKVAASKPYITKCNAKFWMQCCKACCH